MINKQPLQPSLIHLFNVFVEKWIRVVKVTGVTDGPKGIHDLDPEWTVLGDINPYGEEVPKSFTKPTEDLSE